MYNELKFTIRRILRNKVSAIINVTGLTIGIFVSILLLNFYTQESTYDHYHEKANRIHKAVSRVAFSEGKMSNFGISLGTLADDLKHGFTQVEDATRLYGPFALEVDLLENRYNDNQVLFVDYTFLELFDLPVSPQAFQKTSDAIVSAQFARQLPMANPVGQQIEIENQTYIISAVVDIPTNTMFRFDVLVPLESDPFMKEMEQGGLEFETYVLLNEGDNNPQTLGLLKKRHDQLTQDKWPQYVSDNAFIPLKDVYLSDWVSNRFGNGNRQLLNIILSIAILVIALALINYVNIQVANNHSRMAELKLKKIMGASKSIIIKQGAIESSLVIGISGMVALLLTDAFDRSPYSALLGDHSYTLASWSLTNWLFFVTSLMVIGCIAGVIPALKLFSLRSIVQQPIKARKLGLLTVSLVVFQFFVSSSLLTSILFVNAQMDFMRSQPSGYDSEQVVVIENLSEKQKEAYAFIKEQLVQNADIWSVAGAQNKPGSGASGQFAYRISQSEDEGISVAHIRTINGYAETLNLEFVAGGDFTMPEPGQGTQFILNEAAAKQLFSADENPIGETIDMSSRRGKIVGVVKNFHYLSFHHQIEPLMINVEDPYQLTLMVKIQPGAIEESLGRIEDVLKSVDPRYVFDYQFLDEQFDRLYASELRNQRIITYATGVAFSISIIGLLALSIFVINAMMKEIAIRKVLGGSHKHILSKLSGKLVTWIIIGNLISIPASYYISFHWVSDFVYQIGLEHLLWMIPLTSVITLFVAFAVIVRKLYRTIYMNPVLFLRNE